MKDLIQQMLHIVPQKRPTAAQILRHQWLSQPAPEIRHIESHQPHKEAIAVAAIKGAVDATFRAIASPHSHANVGPVVMSELARRRAKDKLNLLNS